ncbi:MAG: EF-Tu/IF-2/RF-3 family GTPase [Candidatus Kariarchaeaceae archaeon]
MHLQAGVLMGDPEARNYLANQWGKKSTSSDITLYTVSSADLVQTTVVPEGYPKKPLALVYTAHMSDSVVLGVPVSGIDAAVGESAILADTLQIPGIKAVVGEQTQGLDSYFEQMDKVFSKLSIKNWKSQMVYDGSGATATRTALRELHPGPRSGADDYLAIEVDHAFPVQGVGSVILGTVTSGTVEKGQKVQTFPEKQKGIVRSIQVNDEDAREAGPGVHVGIALKGILPKYLERGTVIGADNSDQVSESMELKFPINHAKFGKPPEVGDRVHVISGLYDSPAKIVEWGDTAVLQMDKMTPYHPTIRATVLDLNRKPTVLGSKL